MTKVRGFVLAGGFGGGGNSHSFCSIGAVPCRAVFLLLIGFRGLFLPRSLSELDGSLPGVLPGGTGGIPPAGHCPFPMEGGSRVSSRPESLGTGLGLLLYGVFRCPVVL